MSSQFIQIRSVSKQFGKIRALSDINLTLVQGEIVALLGVNGAGKTTLSSIIASLHPPTQGQVLYKGQSIYEQLITYRMKLGFCPQKPTFSQDLTVKELLTFAGHYFLMDRETIKQRVNEVIEQFDLHDYVDAKPDILSGGYRQRLIIARALMHRPELLILDEPTVALDPHIRRALWDLIKQLKQEGVCVLLTTHYLDEAEILADRVCVLDKGSIRLIDTPANLIASYNKKNLEDVFLQLMNEEVGS